MDEKSNIDLRDYFAAQCLRKVGNFPDNLYVEIDGGLTQSEKIRFAKSLLLNFMGFSWVAGSQAP